MTVKSKVIGQNLVTRLSHAAGFLIRISNDVFSKKQPKIWCLGPESNRYVPFGTQDFKSLNPNYASLRIVRQLFEIIKKCVVELTGWDRTKYGLFGGGCHTVVTRNLIQFVAPEPVAEYNSSTIFAACQTGRGGVFT